MQIAQQKLQSNVAEYVLYMYQIEDVIRAYHLDVEAIIENYVRPQLPDESFIPQYRDWYTGLVRDMKSSRIEKSGHLPAVQEVMMELSYLHNTLLNITKDPKFLGLFEAAVPFIDEFKEKSDLKDRNYVEIAFHAMYMKLLLKLQKREISAESEEAFDAMRVFIAYLSRAYHKMKSGDLDFLKN